MDGLLELREFFGEQSSLSQSDGSASFHQGDSSVLAAVYGPGECSRAAAGKESVNKAYVDVVYKGKVGLPTSSDKLVEHHLRTLCNTVIHVGLCARSQIKVCVQEIHNAGSVMSTVVNAVCMALMDSGVPMVTLFAAVTCAVVSDGDGDAASQHRYVLDPDSEQEESARAVLTFVLDSSREKRVLTCITTGCFTPHQYREALQLCDRATDDILAYYKDSVRRRLQLHSESCSEGT